MIAYVCHCTGWTWDEVETNMTMPRLAALEKVWKTSPPVTRSLSFLAQTKGLKVEAPKKTKNVNSALELAEAVQGMGM